MRNESSPDRKEFLEYLEESSKIGDAFRSDPEHQRLREAIDALNERYMSPPIKTNLVDAEYNPNTGHYAQADCPGTGDYVRGMICGVENNAKTPKSERESAQTIALRGIEKMSKKNLGTSAREIARNRSNYK